MRLRLIQIGSVTSAVLLLRPLALPALNVYLCLGFQPTRRVRIESGLPHCRSAAAISGPARAERLFFSELPTNCVPACVELTLPYCRSAAALTRPACMERLSVSGRQTHQARACSKLELPH